MVEVHHISVEHTASILKDQRVSQENNQQEACISCCLILITYLLGLLISPEDGERLYFF